MPAAKHILVVGAGIIGASIAWHLVRAGARVTIVDPDTTGGVATPASFAWLNASWGNPEPYFRLRQRSMRGWTRLAGEAPGIPLRWTGGLCWDIPHAERAVYEAQYRAWGYDIRRVGRAEAAELEPSLREAPEDALFVAEEGMVEPVAATLALLADAERQGAQRVRAQVRALRRTGDRAVGVELNDGFLAADEIVLAAGIATPNLAATADIAVELDVPPGLIVHSMPHPPLLNGLVLAEELHMRQTTEGRLIAGADFGGADPGEDAGRTARDLFARMKGILRGAEALDFGFFTVGLRPTPKDGFPIIGRPGRVDGLYLAVMHSGITLAPAVGLFAAEELVSGRRDPLLAPYQATRFDA